MSNDWDDGWASDEEWGKDIGSSVAKINLSEKPAPKQSLDQYEQSYDSNKLGGECFFKLPCVSKLVLSLK